MSKITNQDALEYHRLGGRPGKLAVTPTKPMATQRDLSLAYTPGVAVPVLEIERDPELAYEYTSKGNLVAVLSNGSAILGLGNRGALAGKPVMEGKAVLFKRFADVDVFDIEVNAKDPETIIQVAAAIAPTFGGINLEDIKAPECFYVEETLKSMLDIPVFHDDQHGTAIISGAALLNGLELVNKSIDQIKVVVSGAGAAAIACAELMIRLGARREHILLVDTKGVVYRGRAEGMNQYKERLANDTPARDLTQALQDADVFYGLSAADILKPEMIKGMARRPLIFAMSNPDPEIRYELARETRPDAIVATGRSDYPNQINNVLGFPFIFRGALDVRAKAINEEMKVAATHALAKLAKQDVPDSVLRAYGLQSLKFGEEYILPKPLDPRVLLWEAPAVAQAAMETGVARRNIDLDAYREQLTMRQGQGETIRYFINHKARRAVVKKRVVFGDGEETRVIRAAAQVRDEGIAVPILLGRPEVIQSKGTVLGVDCCLEIIDPNTFPRLEEYAQAYYALRQRHGVILADARRRLLNKNVFGPMMVKMGEADAFISGLNSNYADVIRPALQIHHTQASTQKAAGVYIILVDGKTYLFSDTTVNIDPTAHDLAEIACLSADFARQLGLEPRVALLSFSNFGSAPHPFSQKVREAVEMIRARCPDFAVDGEMQADTALNPELVEAHYPFSAVKDANVLIFPSLEAANIATKLVAQMSNSEAIGPILLGLGAPIHVLQMNDQVRDIVNTAAMAVMDAMSREND